MRESGSGMEGMAARLSDVGEGVGEFVWSHGVDSWSVFVLLGVVIVMLWFVWLLYRNEGGGVGLGWRGVLALSRCIVIVLLVVIWLGPGVVAVRRDVVACGIVVLVDESLSMTVNDSYDDDGVADRVAGAMGIGIEELRGEGSWRGSDRLDVVKMVLARDDGVVLRGLAGGGMVEVMGFGDSVVSRGLIKAGGGEVGVVVGGIEASGVSTNMAKAMREAMSVSNVAGIVVVSDGQNTEGEDPLAAVRMASDMGVKIVTVGVGDTSRVRNVAVTELAGSEAVFCGEPLVLRGVVRGDAMDGGEVDVVLTVRRVGDDGGEEVVVGEKRVVLEGGLEGGVEGESVECEVLFDYKPVGDMCDAGMYEFILRSKMVTGEVVESDNVKSLVVEMLSDQARVLLISGGPGWEYRVLSRLLVRDRTVDVSCWLQTMDGGMRQVGNTVIDHLPRDGNELFEYDVVVMLDAGPIDFDSAWIELLLKFVDEHGGGVLWGCGVKNSMSFFTQEKTRGICELLPIELDEFSEVDIGSFITTQRKVWPMRLARWGGEHAVTKLGNDAGSNRRIWDTLPGVFWSFSAYGVKPGGQVLVEHTNPELMVGGVGRPLIVESRYGAGRVVYLGMSSTWRWRRVSEECYDRFWVGVIRYLMEGRQMGERGRGRVATEMDCYRLGDKVVVSARLYDKGYDDLVCESVTGIVRMDDEEREIELRNVEGRLGWYEGMISADKIGVGEVLVYLSDEGEAGAKVSGRFEVGMPDVEFDDARLNRDFLRELAECGGGEYLEIDEIDRAADVIAAEGEVVMVRSKPRFMWDRWWVFWVLVGLLSIEWGMRKRCGLM